MEIMYVTMESYPHIRYFTCQRYPHLLLVNRAAPQSALTILRLSDSVLPDYTQVRDEGDGRVKADVLVYQLARAHR